MIKQRRWVLLSQRFAPQAMSRIFLAIVGACLVSGVAECAVANVSSETQNHRVSETITSRPPQTIPGPLPIPAITSSSLAASFLTVRQQPRACFRVELGAIENSMWRLCFPAE
jgi:hypothetical protein